ncbi:polysaccharide deacetylase family protein [Paenibacillus tyrfis]|uniref:polysaccharide deacetylase family protein n=1 Tax=Paenibacillus tyrfis TaxID=1501230 RepID=UPI00209DAEC7|nr:polysaccharide deacetylase family protein [Paenibacillus tyrfis]MCP1311854.1 polysaccharide deacetylase family protein [Paenibacillus tyrfis]
MTMKEREESSMEINRVIYNVPTRKRILALTFNIAFGYLVPVQLLSLLRRKGVKKATFFLTGEWVRLNPGIAKRIQRMGYEIASHGHRHEDYTTHSNVWIEREVKAAKRAIFNATGIKTNMIRTPSGDLDSRVIKKLLSMKQTIVHWDTDSLDWKYKNVKKIVQRVIPHIHPGAIVLLHGCDPWTQTLKALPIILKGIKKKGYALVTVNELLSNLRPKANRK